jgi:hypothetical protein
MTMQQRNPDDTNRRPMDTDEPRGPTTADLAAVGSRPTIEPQSERPANVTPIGTRGETRSDSPGERATQATAEASRPESARDNTPLFASDEAERFRSDWRGIQTDFVDEPRKAVEKADQLVAGTIKRLAEVFAVERTKLEEQWSRGDDISTEDLRIALQRYRSFFDRLLAA